MPFVRIDLRCARAEAAGLEHALEVAGALAVTLEDAGAQALLEPAPGETPLWDQVSVSALFDPERGALVAARLPADCVSEVQDDDWASRWRQHAVQRRFGKRLAIVPSDGPAPVDCQAVVRLDPGLAFGTGGHATTSLCLAWLAEHVQAGLTLIDYGCGSGILALAAAQLGAASVVAVDHDPQALAATRANAAGNGVAAHRLTVCGPDEEPWQQADLLVANILARPLIELAPRFRQLLKPDGRFALAGLLDTQADVVAHAYADWAEIRVAGSEDGWCRLDGRVRTG